MIAFIEALKDDTCTPKPAKLNAWVYIYIQIIILIYHNDMMSYAENTVPTTSTVSVYECEFRM
jgi:hypothetical protein